MSFRNIWLTTDEWKTIREEFPNSFQLNDREMKEWNLCIEECAKWNIPEEPKCFSRCNVYHMIRSSQNPKVVNTLCRENWRPQDMPGLLTNIYDFIGFIITHCKNVNMNTTLEEWDDIRNTIRKKIHESNQRIWFKNDLIGLYHSQSDTSSSSDHIC